MSTAADFHTLQAYIQQLQAYPLRTKMLTSGTLAALQEVLASWIAHDRSKHGHYVSSRVPKMALYGAFISAPMGHVLISLLQRVFAGRRSLRAKILQIIVSNLIVSDELSDAQYPHNPNAKNYAVIDCTNPEFGLSDFNGDYCRSSHIPPSSCYHSRRLLAGDEGELDYVPARIGICAEVPPGANLGTVLQHRRIRHWYIYQCSYQEEEACCVEEEGRCSTLWLNRT